MPWSLEETDMNILDDAHVAEVDDASPSWMTEAKRLHEARNHRDRLAPWPTEDDGAERYDSLLKWAAQSKVRMYQMRDDLFGMQVEAAVALDNWTMLESDGDTGGSSNTSIPTPPPAVAAGVSTEPAETSRVNNRETAD